jgi:hypothetical protein
LPFSKSFDENSIPANVTICLLFRAIIPIPKRWPSYGFILCVSANGKNFY